MAGLVKLAGLFTGLKPNFDVVPRGFVGVEVADADGAVVVKKVLAGSPAEKAGVEAGDVIVAVKAADVTSDKQLSAALAKAGVGTSLKLTVKRGGNAKELTVELGKGL
jgi:serine protease Do